MDTSRHIPARRLGALLCALALATASAGRAADGGDGLAGDWLNRYASARAAAIGGARVALPDEPLAALVNPAAAAWLERGAVQVNTTRLFEDASVNAFGIALPASGRPSLAFNVLSLDRKSVV